ncbi:MAG: hypothetical protein HC831_13415 [Chloroflexia bacterium]|nr:hypothetical protein [Chloroflexia bacterium]
MTNKLLIYSDLITNRLEYTFVFIFEEFFGIDYELTSDYELFKNSKYNKFIYSGKEFLIKIFT